MQGTVKFYNSNKGFGFVAPDDGGKDVFVHASVLERSGMTTLSEGQRVDFSVANDKRTNKPAIDKISAI